MKITFLGTGTSQGIPVIGCKCRTCMSRQPHDNRLRASVMVETGGKVIVIDTGPDFRQQMLRAAADQLDAVLFTHGHKDHIAGLDDIRAFNFINRKPTDIYAEEGVINELKREFAYVFAEYKYPGIPQVVLHEISNREFLVEDIPVIPVRALHYNLPVFGYRISDFTYITDANHIEQKEIDKIRGSKVLVINALRKKQHYSHFTLSEALEIIAGASPAKAYITHISHQMGLHEEVSRELPANVELAYDGLVVKV